MLPQKYVRYHPIRSIKYAFEGVHIAFTREPNLSIQLIIGTLFSVLAVFYELWNFALAHLVLMSVVISMEMMNTAFETLCDVVHLDFHPKIKIVKDMAAGAVLVCSSIWLIFIIIELGIIWATILGWRIY